MRSSYEIRKRVIKNANWVKQLAIKTIIRTLVYGIYQVENRSKDRISLALNQNFNLLLGFCRTAKYCQKQMQQILAISLAERGRIQHRHQTLWIMCIH